jgi:hypothetical protein
MPHINHTQYDMILSSSMSVILDNIPLPSLLLMDKANYY